MDISSGMYELMGSMWVELSFLAFFTLGFALLRVDDFVGKVFRPRKNSGKDMEAHIEQTLRRITAEVEAGHMGAAVTAWRSIQANATTPVDVLKQVAQAFTVVEPCALVSEVVGHMEKHPTVLCNTRAATALLDVAARCGNIEIMEELVQVLLGRLQITPTYQTYEVLLGGYAAAGDETKVTTLCNQIRADRQKLTARGYSLIIKGFLRKGLLDAAISQSQEMRKQGFYVPPFAITLLLRSGCEAGRSAEVFDAIAPHVLVPADAFVLLFEDCLKRNDLEMARRVANNMRDSNVQILGGAYDPLLKLYAMSGDMRALELFEDMVKSGTRISEGLCVGLLARCADAKFLRFAEDIARFVRARDGMTIAVYSALMKVYAYCGMYDKACDLYGQIREQGLEPDPMMYGCLMKFAVECGRTELSRELFERTPSLDIQNYMSLIRAAGRDRDVARALTVLQKIKDAGTALDIAAYNCVLDVCVSAGDMQQAQTLIQEMKTISDLDIITYNTLLKGYCVTGDLEGAKELLKQICHAGLKPNDVSYNCMVNIAVSVGNFDEAWETIDMMESDGVPVDHYTLSIVMKALRKDKSIKEVGRALALLDRVRLDVCSDEVLLNTVLETCIRHREHRRLASVVSAYENSDLRPSVHTYGSLIKACSTLQRIARCQQLWREMVDTRGMEPNDVVLGCMLDALVCNNCVADAVALLREWKSKVPPNTVMYSTLAKGFANSRQAAAAMGLFDEMRESGIRMNTVVYNALIDAQARSGAMNEVSKLLGCMEEDGVTADTITYSTVVKGYCVRGNLEKAVEVFRNMQKTGMATDSIVYNTVLDGCTRHNRMDLADMVIEDMQRNQVIPSNFTLGILVKMYGRRRQLDKAFEVIKELPKKYGFTPNTQVKACLMCACINNNALPRAFEVFADIKAMGHGFVDGKTYGVLISASVRHGRIDQAASLLEEALGIAPRGSQPCQPAIEPDIMEQFVRAVTQRGLTAQVGTTLLDKIASLKEAASSSAPGGSRHRVAGGAW